MRVVVLFLRNVGLGLATDELVLEAVVKAWLPLETFEVTCRLELRTTNHQSWTAAVLHASRMDRMGQLSEAVVLGR